MEAVAVYARLGATAGLTLGLNALQAQSHWVPPAGVRPISFAVDFSRLRPSPPLHKAGLALRPPPSLRALRSAGSAQDNTLTPRISPVAMQHHPGARRRRAHARTSSFASHDPRRLA